MSDKKLAETLLGPLRIEALANGGMGIARADGRVIFVAGAFPGDQVVCRLTREKKNYAEGEVVDLQQPSPLRRIPPCPVADECGGCQWQQLSYPEQLNWKQQLFSDTLTRQAGAEPERILPIVPSPEEFAYRSRVQVKCIHSPHGFITGFFKPKSRFVVSVDSCPLMPDPLNRLMLALRERIAGSRFTRDIPQLDLAIGSDQKQRAVIHFLGTDKKRLIALLIPLAEQLEIDLAIQAGKKKTLEIVRGSGDLALRVDQPEMNLQYAAGGFAQVNLEQNRKLVDAAIAAADLQGREHILDLYCGMGNFSLPLARRAKAVTGVEDFAPSIDMARRNAAENRIANADFHVLPAAAALPAFGSQFDLLLLDPPRVGAYAVAKHLVEQPIGKIIYISCDPQTLARDLKLLLHNGYRLVSSQAFDMFPQTYHIESLTVLEYRPHRNLLS